MRLFMLLMCMLLAGVSTAQSKEVPPATAMKCIKPFAMMLVTFESNPDLKLDLHQARNMNWMEITREQRLEWETSITAHENTLARDDLKTWTVVEPSATIKVQ